MKCVIYVNLYNSWAKINTALLIQQFNKFYKFTSDPF